MRRLVVMLSFAACALFRMSESASAVDDPRMQLDPPCRAVFGGAKVRLRVVLNVDGELAGRVGWRLTSTEQRPLAHDEVSFRTRANEAALDLEIPIPPVKSGVILPAALRLSAYREGQSKPLATLEHSLWVFSSDPFSERRRWLEGLRILLYDPARTTSPLFEKAGVPFAEIHNMEAMEEVREGVIVVGERASWKVDRGLPGLLLAASARGVRVVCLAPAEGRMVLPGAEQNRRPECLVFCSQEVIQQLDKRLDACRWSQGGQATVRGMSLVAEGTDVAAEVGVGWPWLEIGYSAPRGGRRAGRLVVCGFPLVESWDEGPVPRFLFLRILERLTSKTEGESQ